MSEEKVKFTDKMTVTKEMIDAVKAHERMENVRYQQECWKRQREWQAKLDTQTLEKVRHVFPGADKDQFEELYTIFADYFEAMR